LTTIFGEVVRILAMPYSRSQVCATFSLFFGLLACGSLACPGIASAAHQESVPPSSNSSTTKPAPSQKQPSPDQELQLALSSAGTDRVALVRNLEEFLKKYPEAPNRPQIYRAIVEACMQLRDNARAADYAERIMALRPDDISTTILAIQLLEKSGDEVSLRRAVNYSARVLEFIDHTSQAEKSPRLSQEEWASERKRDLMSILSLRGRLEFKLKDMEAAQKDFEASYAFLPTASAAQKLGEIAEMRRDWPEAIQQYARAFALGDSSSDPSGRREIRQKIGNVWRLAHGSEDGLAEYLLRTFDETTLAAGKVKPKKNSGARESSDFILRKAPEGTPFPLNGMKGKVLVVDFWTTWCGPCRALEPLFARVAAEFEDNPAVLFLAADCDEDETLVPPYLQEDKLRTAVVFADGLERLFAVNAFPTVIVIGRDGKTAFRSIGFDPVDFEQELTAAVRRELARSQASAEPATPMR
jgi:thiol-disulfide isomerase/thioredoxin